MGCAVSEEDANEAGPPQDPAILIEHEVAGDDGFKEQLKQRKVLVIGRAEEDRRDELMKKIVKGYGQSHPIATSCASTLICWCVLPVMVMRRKLNSCYSIATTQ